MYDEYLCVCGTCEECVRELNRFPGSRWDDDSLQFPRLLAEIRAIGLTTAQLDDLCQSMDLRVDDIDEILERAERRWGSIKALVYTSGGKPSPTGY